MATELAREPSPGRILRVALDLFSSKGYDAASVREICQAAGITKPTLYHFYGSKEGVYRALVDGALQGFRQRLLDALAIPGPIRDRLERVARAYLGSARDHRQMLRFLFGLIHNPPSSAPATDFPRFYEELVADVGRAIDAAVAAGELRPAPTEIRLLVFMGALGEATCGSLLCGRPELTPELADHLVADILGGWTTR